jgi:hypothetical protein
MRPDLIPIPGDPHTEVRQLVIDLLDQNETMNCDNGPAAAITGGDVAGMDESTLRMWVLRLFKIGCFRDDRYYHNYCISAYEEAEDRLFDWKMLDFDDDDNMVEAGR